MGGLRPNPRLSVLNGRFPIPVWKHHLKGFKKYDYIINGLQHGFRIGFDSKKTIDESRISGDTCYIPLGGAEKQGVSDWIYKGTNKGYISGPFDLNHKFKFGKLFLAPVFVVPKPNGTWRPIVHLSYKKRLNQFTVNDLLCEYMKTVQYIRFREVVNLVNNAGPGAYIFLIDAQDAYYRVPTHPDDWKFMGIKWAKKLWVFRSLQMGCASSPKIYTEFADAVEYICVKKNKDVAFLNGIQQLRHYIDDFFGACPTKKEAEKLYNSVFQTFDELGIPTRVDKCFYPDLEHKILGWLYNTVKRTVGMVNAKRIELLNLILRLIKTMRSDKKSLEKIIGKMQNASLVIFPGKAFIRRLEAVLYLTKIDYNKPISLSPFVIEDLKWWANILSQPDLCCMSFDLALKHPSDGDFKLFSDASSKIGGGGYVVDKNNNVVLRFQIDWKDTMLDTLELIRNVDIELLELLMSIVGIILMLPKLKNKSITIYNDNPGAAGAIRTKAPRLYRLDLQFLIRYLAKLAVENKFYFWGYHFTVKDGKEMIIADQLSRFTFNKENVTDKIAMTNCKNVVNRLLLDLAKQPLNIPKKHDINEDVRSEYNILLNDHLVNYNNPVLIDYIQLQKQYNILTN